MGIRWREFFHLSFLCYIFFLFLHDQIRVTVQDCVPSVISTQHKATIAKTIHLVHQKAM